ncbi:MAG: hypothetical protein E6Q88_09280 [Lysobacteraceae bacterium]|nr:MAG: hypothetical protein E6Q88_09280 [Xanthomonadaceae bacterium]
MSGNAWPRPIVGDGGGGGAGLPFLSEGQPHWAFAVWLTNMAQNRMTIEAQDSCDEYFNMRFSFH